MIKSTHLKPLAIALGTTLAASLATLPAANADENPFSITKLSSGYMVAGKDGEGKCGEGKCGEGKAKTETEDEGKKEMEGKCGEGKCGEGKAKKEKTEGKCGEGKCGEGKK